MNKYNKYGFNTSVNRVLKHEGGYINHKDDKGGETNMGITKQTALIYKPIWPKYNWNGDMKTLPKELAIEIYRLGYWNKIKGDSLQELHPLLADHIFDFYVTSGSWAVKHLQRALNLLNNKQVDYVDTVVDGGLGIGTLNSLRAYAKRRGQEGLDRLVLTLVAMQSSFYLNISEKNPSQESFTNGWLERTAKKTRSYVLAMENNQ